MQRREDYKPGVGEAFPLGKQVVKKAQFSPITVLMPVGCRWIVSAYHVWSLSSRWLEPEWTV